MPRRFERQTKAGLIGQDRAVPRNHDGNLGRLNASATCLNAGDAAIGGVEPGDFAIFNDVDASRIRRSSKSPRHRIMPRGTGAALERRAQYRIPLSLVNIENGTEALDALWVEPFSVNAVELIGVDAATAVAHFLQRMCKIENAPLTEHDVVIEVFGKPLPQLQRVFVKRGAFIPEIVRAHDGSVARNVAAA